jgi:type III pantothenate kinase
MEVMFDIGNTTISCGIYENNELILKYCTATDKHKTIDEYVVTFNMFKEHNNLENDEFSGAMISSVVPQLTDIINKVIKKVFGITSLILSTGSKTGLPIHIDDPATLGGDLVSDAVAAREKYGFPIIIVDLGTANKVVLVDKTGAFCGGVFTPGLVVSINALVSSASLLNSVSLIKPNKVIGKNTCDSMNSGAIYGTFHAINGLVNDFEKEIGYKCKKVLTGGNAFYLEEMLNDYIYDENLTLDGIFSIYKRNISK